MSEDSDRYKLDRVNVDRLKAGDIVRLQTINEHEKVHHAPNPPGHLDGVCTFARNPFDGSNWIYIRGGKLNTTCVVEIDSVWGKGVSATAITVDNAVDNSVYRLKERTEDRIFSVQRDEPVEWSGTPQSRLDDAGDRRETMNEGDLRGNKNDLLDGHM